MGAGIREEWGRMMGDGCSPFMKYLPYSPHVQIDVPSAVNTVVNKGNGKRVQVARLLDYSVDHLMAHAVRTEWSFEDMDAPFT